MKSKVLFGVLNWGMGHAGRSIPVIHELLANGFEVVIASDGEALHLLTSEFPNLTSHNLPGYNIKYPYNSIFLNLFRYSSSILSAIYTENRIVKTLIDEINPNIIISDNRYGFRNKSITSILITHQTTIHFKNRIIAYFANLLNKFFLKKFDRIWIPDFTDNRSIAGKLSKLQLEIPHNYIGILSRMEKIDVPQIYDMGIVLSGPEPQRTILEYIIKDQLKNINQNVLLIRGVVSEDKDIQISPTLRVKDHAFSPELNRLLNECRIIISRSGYSTIMDIVKLGKKAVFIPTTGQTEQEYLAEYLEDKLLYPFFTQNKFDLQKALMVVEIFPGSIDHYQSGLNKAVLELKAELQKG